MRTQLSGRISAARRLAFRPAAGGTSLRTASANAAGSRIFSLTGDGAITPGGKDTVCNAAGGRVRVRDIAIPSAAISKANSGGGSRKKPRAFSSALIR